MNTAFALFQGNIAGSWFVLNFFVPQTQKLVQWLGTYTDIHDRKRAELALFEHRERLEKIISQTASGVVETDVSGRIVMANKRHCQLVGYFEEEMLGTPIIDITAADPMARTLEVQKRLVRGEQGFNFDKQYRRKIVCSYELRAASLHCMLLPQVRVGN